MNIDDQTKTYKEKLWPEFTIKGNSGQKIKQIGAFLIWRPLGVSNPCCRDENPVS